MAQSIRAQALLLLLALGLGAGLGLLYDLLRPLRRRTGDALWDLLFCAAAAFSCFCFAMRSENGRLGSGELAVSLAGFCIYMSLLSPAVAPKLELSARALGGVWIFMGASIKKNTKFRKKTLSKSARVSYHTTLWEGFDMDARRTLIRIVLLALLLYAAGCLAVLGREVQAAQDTVRALTAELASVERENRALRRRLDGDRSTEDWEMLAWQRLGLVRPGEIVFLFPQEEKQA